MNVQQQQQEQAEAVAAFAQGFASVAGTESLEPTVASGDAAAGTETTTDAEREATAATAAEAAAGGGGDPAPGETESKGEPAGEQPASAEAPGDDDPVLLDGLKRSELRRLLGNAADVDGLRKQLDKAHGSIGDLNRRLQQAQTAAPAAVPATTMAIELPEELKQFEQDYPDVAAYVKALGAASQQRQETPPAEPKQPVATGAEVPAQAEIDPLAIELVVMDRMHKGWREKVQSQDFNLWLASQGGDVQQAFSSAQTADGLAAVIGDYDQWATARAAAADKSAKGQQRLKAAVTPSGNAPRPQAAPTEDDAFRAGFSSVMGRR